jgi:arylsulfatase
MVGHQQIKRCGLVHRTSVVPGELDYRVGQILDILDEAGVAKNTIVVWASDNAAAQLAGTVAGSSGSWRWYFGGGWEGSMRTPAIVRWPGRIPGDRPIDGVDVSSLLLGAGDSSAREHFVMLGTDGEVVSVKWKTVKVHFRYAESDSWIAPLVKPQIPSVYDLVADPAETVNLMASGLTVSWVIGEALRPVSELEASAVAYPHIAGGANFSGYND